MGGELLALRVDLKFKLAEKDLMRGEEVPIDRRYNNNKMRRMNTSGMCPSLALFPILKCFFLHLFLQCTSNGSQMPISM